MSHLKRSPSTNPNFNSKNSQVATKKRKIVAHSNNNNNKNHNHNQHEQPTIMLSFQKLHT